MCVCMCVFMGLVEISRVFIPTFRDLCTSCSFFSVSPLPQIKRILHCIAIMYLTHVLTKLWVLSRDDVIFILDLPAPHVAGI